MEVKVLSFNQLLEIGKESIVIISARNACLDIYNNLISSGFPKHQIFIPKDNQLVIFFPNQYFDYFTPKPHEVFVDGGAYDGMSSCEFVDWTRGEYDKIYIYEANDNNEKIIRDNLHSKNITKYELFDFGLWSNKTKLKFDYSNGTAALVTNEGNVEICADSIDNTIKDRVTYIKLDIEGSEYEAILGAQNTIRKYTPRMAISIYHKPEDIIEIPALIMNLNQSYKFAIRHYSSSLFETVLYAWVEE